MRIVAEDAVVVSGSEDFGQIVLIVREHECLQLVGLNLLRCLNQELELDLLSKMVRNI